MEDGQLTSTLVRRTRYSHLCLGDIGLEKRGKKDNQGQVGGGLQQPGVVEGAPAQERVGTGWSLKSLPTQTTSGFYDRTICPHMDPVLRVQDILSIAV